MVNLIQVLFSGVVVSKEGKGGISLTLVLIIIIIALVTVLLVRDKKIRGKVKSFFTMIGRKIKNSRIKSRIEKEEKEITELLAKLGRKGFENNIYPDNSEDLLEKIKKEKEILDKFDKALSDNEKRIGSLKSEHEIFVSLKKSDIEKEESVKDPVEKKYKSILKRLSDLKKESDDNEKRIVKIGGKIEKAKTELERLKRDELLDPEERADRKVREENTIAELNNELTDLTMRESAIPPELTSIQKEEADLKLKLDVFEKNLEKLRKELKKKEDEYDDKISELVKEKGHYTAEKVKSGKALSEIFEKLGNLFDKERPDNIDLSVIYIDIDRARERIKNLRSQLT